MSVKLKRVIKVYPVSNKNLEYYFYRDGNVKQFVNYLHRLSYENDTVNYGIELIQIFEKIGVKNFGVLCELVRVGKIDELCYHLTRIVQESKYG